MRMREGQKRARLWPPNGSAHIEAPLLPDGSPHFSDDAASSGDFGDQALGLTGKRHQALIVVIRCR
jgi:hypothetical protein